MNDFLGRRSAQNHLEADVLEERQPEGILLPENERARHADPAARRGHLRLVFGQQELFAFGEQVGDARVDRFFAQVVSITARAVKERLLSLDLHLADFAVVGAVLALEGRHFVFLVAEIEADEVGLAFRLGAFEHLVAREQRRADRAHDFVVGRDDDLLARHLFERGDDGAVSSGAALVEDEVADALAADDAVEIVGHDRVGQPGDELVGFRAAMLMGEQVGFHEDRAALAETDRVAGRQGQFGELVLNGNAQPLGLFFEERTRSPRRMRGSFRNPRRRPCRARCIWNPVRRSRRWCRRWD